MQAHDIIAESSAMTTLLRISANDANSRRGRGPSDRSPCCPVEQTASSYASHCRIQQATQVDQGGALPTAARWAGAHGWKSATARSLLRSVASSEAMALSRGVHERQTAIARFLPAVRRNRTCDRRSEVVRALPATPRREATFLLSTAPRSAAWRRRPATARALPGQVRPVGTRRKRGKVRALRAAKVRLRP
jgi:hypothetical protein